MRHLRFALLMAAATSPGLFASACVPDTLESYEELGSTGCTEGIFDVKNFTFTVISSTIPIQASDITVTPSSGGDLFSLDFSSPKFLSVSGTNSIDIQIGYFWDPGDIRSFVAVMNDPVSPPGVSQLTVDGCENANFTILGCPTTIFALILRATDPSQTTISALQLFIPGTVKTLGILDTALIEGNGTGSADILHFKDTLTATPEPSTLILVLCGGMALGLRKRRLRRSLHSG